MDIMNRGKVHFFKIRFVFLILMFKVH